MKVGIVSACTCVQQRAIAGLRRYQRRVWPGTWYVLGIWRQRFCFVYLPLSWRHVTRLDPWLCLTLSGVYFV